MLKIIYPLTFVQLCWLTFGNPRMTRIDANVLFSRNGGGAHIHVFHWLRITKSFACLACLGGGGGVGILGKFIVYHFQNARLRISVGATQIQVITRHASTSILLLLQFYADYTRNTNFRFVRILISLWVILYNTLHVKYIENKTWACVDMEFLFECLTR